MKNKTNQTNLSTHLKPLFLGVVIFVALIIATFMLVSLFSFNPLDSAWSRNDGAEITNVAGSLGAWYSDISFSFIGKLSYIIPIAIIVFSLQAWFEKDFNRELFSWRIFAVLIAIIFGSILFAKHDPIAINTVSRSGGGWLGAFLAVGLEKTISSVSLIMIVSSLVFILSLGLIFGISWLDVTEKIGAFISYTLAKITGRKAKTTIKNNYPESNVENSVLKKLDEEENQTKFTIDSYDPTQDADPDLFTEKVENNNEDEFEDKKEPVFFPETNKENNTVNFEQQQIDKNKELERLAEEEERKRLVLEEERNNQLLQKELEKEQILKEQLEKERILLEERIKRERLEKDIIEHEKLELEKVQQQKLELETLQQERFEQERIRLETIEQERLNQEATDLKLDQEKQHQERLRLELIELEKAKLENFNQEKILQESIATEKALQEKIVQDDIISKQASYEQERFDREQKLNKLGASNDIKTSSTIKDSPFSFSVWGTSSSNNSNPITSEITTIKAEKIDAESVEVKAEPKKIEPEILKTSATIGTPFEQNKKNIKPKVKNYKLPNITLLDNPPEQENFYTEDVLAQMAATLENALKQYKINATVMHVSPGPVITRFELDLAPGIPAKKISNLSKDLARALAVSNVRVEEIIPGSTYVGLEVPNQGRQIVYFKDIISSKQFQKSESPLTVSLGADISGRPVVADLMKMPHLLVAGTTGSGKSVAINTMLLSMLYKATPKDLRLILVDPKMLEMSMYEDIPHLLTPVITDMNDAENALTWAVAEMERRYKLMAALKVRKIDEFNKTVEKAIQDGKPIQDPIWQPDENVGYTHHPDLETLPFIVVIIDELADMMMVVGKQVEQLIARLTQKARAAGIHVILATQRPSVDVLTGLIKANVPTRIAFQVSSAIDSRTIIDSVGAETLLGHGDMLFVPPGVSQPQRLHGAFVNDKETDRITNFLRETGEPDYINGITAKQDPETLGAYGAADVGEAKEDADPLYDDAIEIVTTTGKASISSVQRQLRIGYNRAARMIEDMQEQGIVSEPKNGVRRVLVAPPPK